MFNCQFLGVAHGNGVGEETGKDVEGGQGKENKYLNRVQLVQMWFSYHADKKGELGVCV